MSVNKLHFFLGTLLGCSVGLLLSTSQSALAQNRTASDVTGPVITTSGQSSGVTTSPGNASNTTSQLVTIPYSFSQGVNVVAVTLSNPTNITNIQSVTNASGQSVPISVPTSVAIAVTPLLSAQPPTAATNNTVLTLLSSSNGTSTSSVPASQIQQLVLNNPVAIQFLASIPALGINSGQSVQAVAQTLGTYGLSETPVPNSNNVVLSSSNANPAIAPVALSAIALSVSLQGLSSGTPVSAQQLANAVSAYNNLIQSAASLASITPGATIESILGPNILGVQAVLGKMVDAGFAAK